MIPANQDRRSRRLLVLSAFAIVLSATAAFAGDITPSFSKAFAPSSIGSGSVSVLTFTINNAESNAPATQLAFSDNLPSGVTLAAPALVSNSCFGTLTAPNGGSTITLVDGLVGGFQTCTIVVNVTASGAATYMNVSGDLTSSAGNSGPAIADLTVAAALPGFSKGFAPSTVPYGGSSTLTFTIDNSCAGCNLDIASLQFTDDLPAGMVVAAPANASTDCESTAFPATLTAVSGTSVIGLGALGFVPGAEVLAAGATCTVSVDVIGGAVGSLGNVSGELVATFQNGATSVGKAAAVLEVAGVTTPLLLSKEFTDDPVPPGGSATLRFRVTNRSRDEAATGITFADDLGATLAVLTPTLPPVPDPPCGAGSSLGFSLGVLTLTGGNLPPEATCSFELSLAVPAGTAPGAYSNAAGPVSGDVGGSPVIGNVANDLLLVVSFPVLTKEFTDDPVAASGTVTLEFTITNPEATSTMSGIAFVDELTDSGGPDGGFLPFPVSVTLPPTPNPPCGPGSVLALVSLGTERQGLSLTGGSLAASDGAPGGATPAPSR